MPTKEKRVVLPGSARVAMPGAREVGPADPKERIEVTVFLRRGSSPQKLSAAATGKLPPAQRQHLSRAQFAEVYVARPRDLKKDPAFAAKYGFKIMQDSRTRPPLLLR